MGLRLLAGGDTAGPTADAVAIPIEAVAAAGGFLADELEPAVLQAGVHAWLARRGAPAALEVR